MDFVPRELSPRKRDPGAVTISILRGGEFPPARFCMNGVLSSRLMGTRASLSSRAMVRFRMQLWVMVPHPVLLQVSVCMEFGHLFVATVGMADATHRIEGVVCTQAASGAFPP